jgi:hypothetical protein
MEADVQTSESTSATAVLEADHTLPQVPRAPAPWQLEGSAYVLLVNMPEQVLDQAAFVPASLAGKRKSRMSVVMWVDYRKSNAGPYRELLMVPGTFATDEGTYHSISRIFVSTYDSVVNGRANWGIPKDRADFSAEPAADGGEHLRAGRDGHVFAELNVRAFGPTLPVRSWLLPPRMLTLVQHWRGQSYRLTLKARGVMRMAKLQSWRFDPQYFPDLARGRVLAAAHLPRFEMEFPVAELKPLPA